MKNKIIFFGLICISIISNSQSKHAITYILTNGRHGDHIVTYLKAKWLSYKYNIPLLYKPFKYSDKLTMHQSEQGWNKNIGGSFAKKIRVKNEADINVNLEVPTLFEIESTVRLHDEYDENHLPLPDDFRIFLVRSLFESIVKNHEFKQEVQKILTPVYDVPLIEFPEDCISVAMHIRTGGAYTKDKRFVNQQGLRFCKEQFYINQLIYLSELLDDCPLFVWIFTDDADPQALCERIEVACNKPNILFGCRTEGNHFERNVIEDMWCMSKFDCLIRPNSHFSFVAQLMGNHKIIISPYNALRKGRNAFLNDVMISFCGNGRLLKFVVNEANLQNIKEAVSTFL